MSHGIEVKGLTISFSGKPAFVAAEVQKDGEILKLRDDTAYQRGAVGGNVRARCCRHE